MTGQLWPVPDFDVVNRFTLVNVYLRADKEASGSAPQALANDFQHSCRNIRIASQQRHKIAALDDHQLAAGRLRCLDIKANPAQQNGWRVYST